ncbi:type I 3-dehydroquinate dehydratase [Halorussus gelatinilyticus]|uniref:3-dehydroquinate dehydratase n=1 Tax=Halorussus gelatinilyticus TaxID=2937524 RepID=A0A8U0IEE0_9EURY|nr:type I 3-dehydroquinate dehydratase [Halorussus gelatinilyticus]UPV99065.1 type I 3-dehydroquinate dehydratase [Halorussus gelatinilyticus]
MNFEEFVLAASLADLDAETDARAHADAVEFRMDLASDPLATLGEYDGELPVLATNRAVWEGGEAEDDEARLAELAEAAELACVGAVDVELESLTAGEGERVAERARRAGTRVVASVHDFERTPPKPDLREDLETATRLADVGKLAVTAESRSDVLDLLAITREFDAAGERVATMAMGAPGRHSRAVAPLYGSKIGYAPVAPEDATAPGQYDLETLARLVDDLS